MRLLLLLVLLATTAQAEIRVYQPPEGAEASLDVTRETHPETTEAAVPSAADQAWQQQVENQWNQLIQRQRQELAPASVQIFLRPENYNGATITMLNELLSEPQVQAQNPEVFMADTGNPETMVNLMVNPEFPPLAEALEIGMDDGNERAKSYGIGIQDTLVYSGSTGAVRLYILPYDLYRFKEQLARDVATPQADGK